MRKLTILFLILLIKIGKLEDKPKSTKFTVIFSEFLFSLEKHVLHKKHFIIIYNNNLH